MGKVNSVDSLDRTNWEDIGSVNEEGAEETMEAEDALCKRPLDERSLSEDNEKICRRDVRWKLVTSRTRRLKPKSRISQDSRKKEAHQ